MFEEVIYYLHEVLQCWRVLDYVVDFICIKFWAQHCCMLDGLTKSCNGKRNDFIDNTLLYFLNGNNASTIALYCQPK